MTPADREGLSPPLLAPQPAGSAIDKRTIQELMAPIEFLYHNAFALVRPAGSPALYAAGSDRASRGPGVH